MPDWKKCSNDPIPAKAIRLSEAFERVHEALRNKPEVLNTLNPELREYLIKNRQTEEKLERSKSRSPQSLIALHHLKESVVFFRSKLGRGDLVAYIRDPKVGELLELDTADWEPVGNRLLFLEPPYAFEEDFLDDAPFSGNPKTFIHGAYRPVFLIRKDFEIWLKKTFGTKDSGGRPLGSGSYEKADRPLLEKMRQLLKANQAKSVLDAARMVAKEAPGHSVLESKITRLAKRYKLFFSSEKN